MKKLNKYLQLGGAKARKVVVEKGEYIEDLNKEVTRVADSMPTHDDPLLITPDGPKKVKAGKGGVLLNDVARVVSATTENRPMKHKNHGDTDQAIKFLKDEAEAFIFENFRFKTNLKKSVSPAGVMDAALERKDNFVKKFNNIDYRTDNPYSLKSLEANKAVLETLPEIEDIFEATFNEQEARKLDEQAGVLFQTGGYSRVPSPQDLGITSSSDRAALQVRNALKDDSAVRARREAAARNLAEERRVSGRLTPAERQPMGSKAVNIALNPMTAAGYLVREGRVPDNMMHGDQNLFDSALQLGLNGGAAAAVSGLSVAQDVGSGNGGLGTAVEAISGLAGVNKVESLYNKYRTSQRTLKAEKDFQRRLNSTNEGIEWMRKWYNDPITKEKADKFFSKNYPKHFTKDNLEDKIQLVDYDEIQHIDLDLIKNDITPLGAYVSNAVDRYPGQVDEKDFPLSGKVLVANDRESSPIGLASTAVHELTHLMTDGERFLNSSNRKGLAKNLRTFNTPPHYLSDFDNYLSEPTEIYARFNELRKAEGLTPGAQITPEHMEAIMKKGQLGQYPISSRFFNIIADPEYTREFLNNTLPASAGVVGTAGLVSQNQKQQTGGENRGVVQSPNRNLVTTVRLKDGRVVPIRTIDGVIPDRAAFKLPQDSVTVDKDWMGNYHATKYYDATLKKYVNKK